MSTQSVAMLLTSLNNLISWIHKKAKFKKIGAQPIKTKLQWLMTEDELSHFMDFCF